MREPDASHFKKPREDVVVSVCFSDLAANPATFAALRDVAATLDRAFRFREIILVVDDTQREAFLPLIAEVPNCRLFVVRRGTEYYDRRVIAAEEAIGDLVVIGNLDEIVQIDLIAFLDHAERENTVTMAFRAVRRPVKRLLAWPFIALGKLAGFNVDPSDFQSIAVPRTLLNLLLAHDEPRLALRFPPRDPRLPLDWFRTDRNVPARTAFMGLARRAQLLQTLLVYLTPTILSVVAHDEPRLALRFPPRDPRLPLDWFRTDRNVPGRTAFMGLGRRMQLLQTLLVYLTPTILSVVAISSTILTLLGMAYAAWIVGAVFFVDTLAPGWLTTNAMLAVSAVFMGLSTLGLSLGLQHLLKQQRRLKGGIVPEEVNRIDLFQQVAFDLNVELESDVRTGPAGPD